MFFLQKEIYHSIQTLLSFDTIRQVENLHSWKSYILTFELHISFEMLPDMSI